MRDDGLTQKCYTCCGSTIPRAWQKPLEGIVNLSCFPLIVRLCLCFYAIRCQESLNEVYMYKYLFFYGVKLKNSITVSEQTLHRNIYIKQFHHFVRAAKEQIYINFHSMIRIKTMHKFLYH